ncbi:endonuclease/exonuclease/phosphatase family protein [Streptomyces acidiscabies]|uniref:Endonuclease/exonuclease/phosphatase family protein n=1 Tax=Streptomyces acidiscabies TaxID=42234 RepID=A0ABU4MAD4_9ACTN|nr:endonuclease/exonuclease/phosphatase family protein [Streptomyces acidiscabies]MDX3024955.1 endonuclease/exonuclease/phosphatase family protein [Streptomyces acidiscabies]
MNAPADDELVMVAWNIQKNARGRTGDEDHRAKARSIVASLRPHIYIRQELTGADRDGNRDLYAEANAVGGLIPYIATPDEKRGRNPAGLMIDPRMFLVDNDYEHQTPWKGIRHVRVRFRQRPKARALNLASAHLCYFDPAIRATEARRLTALADHGQSVLFEADMNSYPHRDVQAAVDHPHLDGHVTELPDWDTVEDRVHFQHRTVERNGVRVSDTVPDEILTGGKAVYTDLALHAATVLRQHAALTPTSSLQRTDQGPRRRIDIPYGTPDVADALKSVEIIATDEIAEVTDHGLVIARFHLDRLIGNLSRPQRHFLDAGRTSPTGRRESART